MAQAEQLKSKGDAAGALIGFQQAAAIDPKSARFEDEIGFLLAVLNRRDEALSHFTRAIDLDPRYAAGQYHLGAALWLSGDHAGLPHLELAAAFDPDNAAYQMLFGEALVSSNKLDDALPHLTAATRLNDHDPHAWKDLGSALDAKGDLLAASDAYSRAVTLAPGDHDLRNTYGMLLVNTRHPEEGLAQFQKVLTEDPADSTAQMNIGVVHLKKFELDKAVTVFRNLLAQNANLAPAHYNLGVALKDKDDLEGATAEFKRALTLDPKLAEAHYMLGITYWQAGSFDIAAAELRAAIAIQPEYADAYFLLGTALKQKGDFPAAEEALRAAIRLDPGNPGPYNTLAQLLRRKGDLAGSKQMFAEGARVQHEKEAQLGVMLERK